MQPDHAYHMGFALHATTKSKDSTQAAREEGFSCILIEREAEYQADIRRRLGLAPSFAEFMADKPAPTLAEFLASK